MSIEFRHLNKAFGKTVVCDDVDLSIRPGELVALLGPSGSGKTTLLRIIAGLEVPDSGSVHIDGRDVTRVDVRDRHIGFVFQHYALFGHLTIFENVAFGLRVQPRAKRPAEAVIRKRVLELLDLVQLGGLDQRFPAQLSGGQRQRVALARALAVEPSVLLLDEPFGALDARVRKELRRWLRSLHDEVSQTSVFVTHDQEEAMEVADRIVVMNNGRIEQVGTPAVIYDEPASPFVFRFVGDANVLPALPLPRQGVELAQVAQVAETGLLGAVHYVRPQDLEILVEPSPDAWPATLWQVSAGGARTRLEFRRDTGPGEAAGATAGESVIIDADLPRQEFDALRQRWALERGSKVFLRPRRSRQF